MAPKKQATKPVQLGFNVQDLDFTNLKARAFVGHVFFKPSAVRPGLCPDLATFNARFRSMSEMLADLLANPKFNICVTTI